PKEKSMKNELKQLALQNELIKNEMTDMEETLDQLQKTDEELYMSIFESKPVSDLYKKGGIKRYRELDGYSNAYITEQTSQRLDMIREKIYMQAKSYDDLVENIEDKDDMLQSIPVIMPINNDNLKRTASGYGMKMHPIYKIVMFHNGMDFTAPIGTEVFATGKGVVTSVVKSQKNLGNYVTIDHGYGYTSTYAHLDKINVKKGQRVNRGDVIGLVGNSGLSVAPHLHYEIKYKDKYVDPANFFFSDLSLEEYEKLIEITSSTSQSYD
ncbi:MAG: M23 family metallopeptidase, partial [Bacteroidales bacterium]|nr:M23 family metallopeptidase [Bacteroidales bacterium]